MYNDRMNVTSKDILARLDLLVGDLAYLGFYHLADRLEELTGDCEEEMVEEGMETE